MNIKIADFMVKTVITTQPHKTLNHIKDIMKTNGISAVPVVNSDNEPVGIVTSNDLTSNFKDNTPVSLVIKSSVYQIPAYNDISIAARVMRKHRFHHLLVTYERKLVGHHYFLRSIKTHG